MVKAASPSVKAIFILDSDGNRVCAKYYDKSYPTQKEQLALEKKLFAKTKNSSARMEADIVLIENIVSVFRCGSDTTMHVIGSASENELILLTVLDSAFDAVSNLLKGRMDRHVMLDNIELVLLTFDEVVDGGYDDWICWMKWVARYLSGSLSVQNYLGGRHAVYLEPCAHARYRQRSSHGRTHHFTGVRFGSRAVLALLP
ncbi:hypothetical protein F441_04269 [Phytophthora nicotianae CJ01A1]|uniref:Coatomer subunit zeta n=2 Tax=Phytophthora nicotianae TaxID=4792 RepID=W2HD53_PHYNI|nr:hypothetical protein L915_04178 [Phytophthora nicotianae]ETL45869.1 hypothetical protein L916_04132 [Phytophthora nicotianae]ETP22442.1 hypothetical protein F441_04269 [Phytophthora nicotianae CJ01A1]